MHRLRGKPALQSSMEIGKYYWVPDGWDQPDRMVHPTRLVSERGKNKHQELFAGPVCLRFGTGTLAACFRPQVRKMAAQLEN